MKSVVLVTAIGTVTSTAIVTELKKTNEYYIIGADVNQQYEVATSLDVDEYHVFPYVEDASYIDFVIQFCKDHNVEYYYAVLDKEVVKISKERRKFLESGTKLCVANYEFAKLCHFKNNFNQWIANHIPQLAIKTYSSMEELPDGAFPVFVKPVEGVASSGCQKIDTIEELRTIVSENSFNNEILVQEFIEGDIITVDLVRNRKTKQKAQIQRRELLRNANGCGIAVEIMDNPQLREICDNLMEELDLNGVANAEFFCLEQGTFADGRQKRTYKIIEINPRFSAGSRYSCMAGINTVLNARRIADRQACEFGFVMAGKHFAERYEAYPMD